MTKRWQMLSRPTRPHSRSMPLITLIITLAIIGLCLWLLETYVPMDPAIKTLIRVVVVVAIILWLLQGLGVMNSGPRLVWK